jgi:hypothetical protein
MVDTWLHILGSIAAASYSIASGVGDVAVVGWGASSAMGRTAPPARGRGSGRADGAPTGQRRPHVGVTHPAEGCHPPRAAWRTQTTVRRCRAGPIGGVSWAATVGRTQPPVRAPWTPGSMQPESLWRELDAGGPSPCGSTRSITERAPPGRPAGTCRCRRPRRRPGRRHLSS